jgi:hypothetical protein
LDSKFGSDRVWVERERHRGQSMNCDKTLPLWLCDVGNGSGYVSSVVWLVVLAPQLWHNWRRRSTEGLSLAWAIVNFTASLFNSFFVFRNDLPLFSKFSAVYMPLLEGVLLSQFVWFHAKPLPTSFKILFVSASIVWSTAIILEFVLPSVTSWLSWAAIVLWSVELVPQLYLNQQIRSTEGQATCSLLFTFMGKTTDFLSAYLLSMPTQFRVLAYFSSTQAFLNIVQWLWYSHSASQQGR